MAPQDEKDLKDVTAVPAQDEAAKADPDAEATSGEAEADASGDDAADVTIVAPPAEAGEDSPASADDEPVAEVDDGSTTAAADGDGDVDDNPTVAIDDGPTAMASSAPEDATAAIPVSTGADAPDDAASPTDLDDLTAVQAPVSIKSPVKSLPERKRRIPRWAIAVLAVVLVAVAAAAVWYTYEQELWGGKTVPSVVGLTQEEAVEALEGLGFEVSIESVLADENIGVVLACSPLEGERVDPADGITLTVAAQRTIPQVVGMDVEDAQDALAEVGAQNILLTYQNSEEASGTVLSVTPGEGEAFTSEDQITLVVARPYTVPGVLGMTLEEAEAELTAAGLVTSVTYVSSDDDKGTVVSTDPGVGEQVEAGATVTLSVATPLPSEPYDLLAYFDAIPMALAAYLEEEGFTLSYGSTYVSSGNARVAYIGASGDLLQIMNNPENGRYSGDSQADVLSWGASVGGVRYSFSAKTLPNGADVESVSGVRAVMAACGFEGLLDTCTQDDLEALEAEDEDSDTEETEDEESDANDSNTRGTTGYHFICGYGRQGDYTWAVIIGGYGDDTHVVALVAPTSHFSSIDLTPYGGSVCAYIAYVDQYAG